MTTHRVLRASRTFAALLGALWLAACGAIIGIPDRDIGGEVDAGAVTVAPNDAGQAPDGGADVEVNDAGESNTLATLTTSHGTLMPAFSPTTFAYEARVSDPFGELPFTITATAARQSARITIDGNAVASGIASAPFALGLKRERMIPVAVQSPDGAAQSYSVHVTNAPAYTYVKPSYGVQGGHFGAVVALSGDTLAVGEPDEGSDATGIDGDAANHHVDDSGAVFIFRRAGGAWKPEAYLKASNAGEYFRFGASLAIDGDTLLVGSPGEASNATGVNGEQHDTTASGSGAVYVFTRSGNTWVQQAYLKAGNSRAWTNFGTSVAIEGDTAVVGASNESSAVATDPNDTSGDGSGAVYVFSRAAGVWAQNAYLKASNAFDQQVATSHSAPGFGCSVSISGNRIAVGASGESSGTSGVNKDGKDISAPASGAAYVFLRTGGTWAQEAYVKASNLSGRFGTTVAISQNLLAVGAPNETSSATGINGDQRPAGVAGAGAVYVFSLQGAAWAQEAYVKASNTSSNSLFGATLALSANHLVVGAPGEASKSTAINGDQNGAGRAGAGAAYTFVRTPSAWEERGYVKASVTHSNASFGSALAIGGGALAVGSSHESSGATGINGNALDTTLPEAGAVFILE